MPVFFRMWGTQTPLGDQHQNRKHGDERADGPRNDISFLRQVKPAPMARHQRGASPTYRYGMELCDRALGQHACGPGFGRVVVRRDMKFWPMSLPFGYSLSSYWIRCGLIHSDVWQKFSLGPEFEMKVQNKSSHWVLCQTKLGAPCQPSATGKLTAQYSRKSGGQTSH